VSTPTNRPGLGDDPGRRIDDPEGRGYLEWRWAPAHAVEIVNIEVGNEYRRQGVGRSLLWQLIAEAGPELRAVFAVTRASNGIAREWYAAMGFYPAGILYGFYDGDAGMPDAVLYVLHVKKVGGAA
jgi:ribosomal protein S18 acetylase RimI-like enzyme